MIEKELKILISEEQYNILDQNINWEKEYYQENYYFLDKMGELRQREITVRIRKKENKLKLQTKVPIKLQNALNIKEEKEKDIDCVYDVMGKKIFGELIEIQAEELYNIGVLVTKRKIFTDDGCEIALDKNYYLDKLDFELEIEYSGETISERVLNAMKRYIDIDLTQVSRGKNYRFLDEYDKINESRER